jgi:hypothetical protein
VLLGLLLKKWAGQQEWSDIVFPSGSTYKFPSFWVGTDSHSSKQGRGHVRAEGESLGRVSTHFFSRAVAKGREKRPSSDQVDGIEFKAKDRDFHLLFLCLVQPRSFHFL